MKYIITFLLMVIVSLTFAQYQCNWNTFSSGGGNMSSTNYLAGTTLGQTAIGALTSSNMLAKIGFWYPLPVIGIMEEKSEEVIQTFPLITKLYSAKPNPFKNQTAITYSLSAESKVILLIYDISGRLVRTLVNENKPSGIYNLNWNARNDRDQTVAEGIYFYTLQTDNYKSTKKFVLTR